MAVGRKKTGSGGWLLFWLAFIIGITLLFMLNLERIKTTLQETRVLDHLAGSTAAEGETVEADEPVAAVETQPTEPVLTANEAETANVRSTAETSAAPSRTASQIKTVERSVYLMKVDNNGTILWTKVNRSLPASESPLQDALESLMRGPSADEAKQGLISLIPKNVTLLNATVRGNTAYLSFSEDFLFNTFGVEGYVGQRRQIVLTATEFSNVKDVQILIDGKRIDYLGEGIWIGSPVSRSML